MTLPTPPLPTLMPDKLEGWLGERRLIRDYVADRPEMSADLRGDFKRDSRVVERLIRYYGARVAREEAARAKSLVVG